MKVFRAARARIRRKLFRTRPGPETGGLSRVSPDNIRVIMQPMSAANGDVEGDQLELEVQTAAHPESGQRYEVHTTVSGHDSQAIVEKPGSVSGEELLSDFPDYEQPVRGSNARARHLSYATGQVLNDVEVLTGGSSGRLGCRSESDVVGKQYWMIQDDVKKTSTGSEMRVKRPPTLTISCDDEQQHQQQLDDVFEVSTKPEKNLAPESDLRRPNGRPAELEGADRVVLAPVCTVTSSSTDQDVIRPANCDHHCLVEDASSAAHHLCLPRKAADRLLTPAATPVHRSSWADLTRSLIPAATALRIHLHRSSVTERAAGRTARQMLEQRRERKAARTLAIITGTFVLCWLPFFIVAILMPFCGDHCHLPTPLISVIIWLGYVNSLLNPIIYTVFNADFRSAFRKILFGKYRSRRR